jgi:hypothetical protein
VQECQPLGHHLLGEKIDAGRVAAWPREAGNKTKLDRVIIDTEDNRNRRGCSFGRNRGIYVAGRGDDGYTTADQVSHQRQTRDVGLHRREFRDAEGWRLSR